MKKFTIIITTDVTKANIPNVLEAVKENINETGFMTGHVGMGSKYYDYRTLVE